MSNFEVAGIDRLVQIGAPDYATILGNAEKGLGSALWKVIDLERQQPGNHPDGGPDFSRLGSREVQIGQRTSATLVFRAATCFENYAKPDWLLHVHETALVIDSFSRDLPHLDDGIAQSTLIIRPKSPISAYGQQEYRNAPYTLETEAPERLPLPASDIETVSRILGKIAAEYV